MSRPRQNGAIVSISWRFECCQERIPVQSLHLAKGCMSLDNSRSCSNGPDGAKRLKECSDEVVSKLRPKRGRTSKDDFLLLRICTATKPEKIRRHDSASGRGGARAICLTNAVQQDIDQEDNYYFWFTKRVRLMGWKKDFGRRRRRTKSAVTMCVQNFRQPFVYIKTISMTYSGRRWNCLKASTQRILVILDMKFYHSTTLRQERENSVTYLRDSVEYRCLRKHR